MLDHRTLNQHQRSVQCLRDSCQDTFERELIALCIGGIINSLDVAQVYMDLL